jgi:hypothetical protein
MNHIRSRSKKRIKPTTIDEQSFPIKIEDAILKKVAKYFIPNEINHFQKELLGLTTRQVTTIKTFQNWIESQFKDDGLDSKILACLMFELNTAKNRIDDENNRYSVNSPTQLQEIESLIEINDLLKEGNFYLKSITIDYGQKPVSNSESKPVIKFKKAKLKDVELQKMFLEFLVTQSNLLEILKVNAKSMSEIKTDRSYKNSRTYFKGIAAMVLKKYFKDYLVGEFSEDEIYFRGGTVLNYLQLLKIRKEGLSKKQFKVLLISNFKKVARL